MYLVLSGSVAMKISRENNNSPVIRTFTMKKIYITQKNRTCLTAEKQTVPSRSQTHRCTDKDI